MFRGEFGDRRLPMLSPDGVGGIALFTVAWLMGKNGFFPKYLSYLGYVSAVLLVVLYLGRMILLDPGNPVILYSAIANGFLINPAWYIWLGLVLLRHERHGFRKKRNVL